MLIIALSQIFLRVCVNIKQNTVMEFTVNKSAFALLLFAEEAKLWGNFLIPLCISLRYYSSFSLTSK